MMFSTVYSQDTDKECLNFYKDIEFINLSIEGEVSKINNSNSVFEIILKNKSKIRLFKNDKSKELIKYLEGSIYLKKDSRDNSIKIISNDDNDGVIVRIFSDFCK